MEAIFSGMTELYLKHHRTSRLKSVWETIREQLTLWLSQAVFSEQHNSGSCLLAQTGWQETSLHLGARLKTPKTYFGF